MTRQNYTTLSNTALINLAIDYVKISQVLPAEVRTRLAELNLLQIIDPEGITDED